MNLDALKATAMKMVGDGKGILAADESTPTIGKRFETINTESTEESRRRYREMLFTSEGAKACFSCPRIAAASSAARQKHRPFVAC